MKRAICMVTLGGFLLALSIWYFVDPYKSIFGDFAVPAYILGGFMGLLNIIVGSIDIMKASKA